MIVISCFICMITCIRINNYVLIISLRVFIITAIVVTLDWNIIVFVLLSISCAVNKWVSTSFGSIVGTKVCIHIKASSIVWPFWGMGTSDLCIVGSGFYIIDFILRFPFIHCSIRFARSLILLLILKPLFEAIYLLFNVVWFFVTAILSHILLMILFIYLMLRCLSYITFTKICFKVLIKGASRHNLTIHNLWLLIQVLTENGSLTTSLWVLLQFGLINLYQITDRLCLDCHQILILLELLQNGIHTFCILQHLWLHPKLILHIIHIQIFIQIIEGVVDNV